MGFSLYIQHSNGDYIDSEVTTLASALETFDSVPWRKEFADFESLPREQKSERYPEFGLVDDLGRGLRIFPSDVKWTAFSYSYPVLGVLDGSTAVFSVTDSLPAGRTRELIEIFFTEDHRPILQLLEEYPRSQLLE
jgi:hypothetical protein